jgi:transcription antitermination factor NusB
MIYKTKAREDAFLVLYQWDIRGGSIEELIEEYLSMNRVKNSEQRRYMRKLIRTYFEHAGDIDKTISDNLENWDFDRLGYVERAILRLAVAELLHAKVKNPKVVIKDYINITYKYAGNKPSRFVNGIISKVLKAG